MQIKRRITKIGHSLNPQIEAMNVATEMELLLDRFEELVRYAQEKIDRSIERGKTIGAKVAEKRASEQKIITDHQKAESDENLADQQEAFDERNKKPGMEDGPETVPDPAEDEDPLAGNVPIAEDGPETTETAAASAAQRKEDGTPSEGRVIMGDEPPVDAEPTRRVVKDPPKPTKKKAKKKSANTAKG